MIRLSREIRFALVPPEEISREGRNSWAGWPSSDLLVPQLRLQLEVQGRPDPQTGYLCNIQVIDQLLRQVVASQLGPASQADRAGQLVRQLFHGVEEAWDQAMARPDSQAAQPPPLPVALTLHLSPCLKLTRSRSPNMTPTATTQLTYQFEFSAAHRLHCPGLSDEENRQVFGKCNNPSGHGHNYVVEVALSGGEVDGTTGQVLPLPKLESIVNRTVIDRLDHRHLNEDVPAFAELNPSVENIARVIYQWLEPELVPAQLDHVQVYETPKTWARFGRTPE